MKNTFIAIALCAVVFALCFFDSKHPQNQSRSDSEEKFERMMERSTEFYDSDVINYIKRNHGISDVFDDSDILEYVVESGLVYEYIYDNAITDFYDDETILEAAIDSGMVENYIIDNYGEIVEMYGR